MTDTPGVYLRGSDGAWTLVHAYLNESYALADVADVLQYGRATKTEDGDAVLTLSRKDMTDVANLINASSFDYDDGFVEMCLDMARHATDMPGAELVFIDKG